MVFNDNRIAIEPAPAKANKKTTISYHGMLTNSGADEVFLHYGFDGWNNADTIAMSRQKDGSFKADVKAQGCHEINLCFKDSANNWDNNNGWNWKVDIL